MIPQADGKHLQPFVDAVEKTEVDQPSPGETIFINPIQRKGNKCENNEGEAIEEENIIQLLIHEFAHHRCDVFSPPAMKSADKKAGLSGKMRFIDDIS